MLNYTELARLRRIRRFLRTFARGAGAEVARHELDEWIAEEVLVRKHAKRLDAPPPSGPQIIEKGVK